MPSHGSPNHTETELVARLANERHEIIESLNHEIDLVVGDTFHHLGATERSLIKQWAVDMKGQLGTDGIQSFLQALRIVKVEKAITTMIRNFRSKVQAGQVNSIFTENRSAILSKFQPRNMVDEEYEAATRHATQRSLRHSSRIIGRHARILGVETGREANDGGYWLQQA